MNWYGISKQAVEIGSDRLKESIIQSISMVNNGNWTVKKERIRDHWRRQVDGRIDLIGESVKYPNDAYDVIVYYKVNRREINESIPHPDDLDPLLSEEERWESVENMSNDKFESFDTETGHSLLRIIASIGKSRQGDGDPNTVQIDQELAQVGLSKNSIERTRVYSDSPYGIAQQIKSIIDFDNDGDDRDDSFPEVPDTGQYIEEETRRYESIPENQREYALVPAVRRQRPKEFPLD